jgi:3-hydroxyacyl-[acyl-carrier-protein] dehydratase
MRANDGENDDASAIFNTAPGSVNARFKRPVTAGDSLRITVNLTRHVRGIWKFSAVARVEDVVAAEAELMCTVRDLPA